MSPKKSFLKQENRFRLLSIKDLIEARDSYHVFLTRKINVIGTAIGRSRNRIKGVPGKAPKTLENSEVRSNAYPCILVFVKEWLVPEKFGVNKNLSYDDFVPSRLYLPDGRIIPVCVIETKWISRKDDSSIKIKFPGSIIGGGYPVITKVQGEDRFATLGCLVTDGRLTFALTNAHVAGRPGEYLYTLKNGNEDYMGVTSQKQLLKKPFSEVYEGFPSKHTLINLDIGLIELDDIQNISPQVFGLGELNGVADINHDTLSLNLIGCHLKGFGCSSGLMKGEIIALFYRYSTSGGYDYVADYLVGSRKGKGIRNYIPFMPAHGDSGTLMVVDEPNKEEHMKVLGVLWGGQQDVSGNHVQQYGLVTNFGTICKLLDIELVYGWKKVDNYFAAYAHTVLPSWCPEFVNDKTLKTLMNNNSVRFSLPISDTKPKDTRGISNLDFVYLSDVPDLVWKSGKHRRGKEGPNHFADMDQKNKDGKTLIDICTSDSTRINPAEWNKYYESIEAEQKGTLPFRIALIFEEMAEYARNNKKVEFVCAAGILVHYVFDAAMPLHISYLHHGDVTGQKKKKKLYGKEIDVPLAYEVHEEFDTQMVEYYADEIIKKLPGMIRKISKMKTLMPAENIADKYEAAKAAVQLMINTITKAPPDRIVEDFEKYLSLSKRERCDLLWKSYNSGLMTAMAEAVILSTRLWEAAWKAGDGIAKDKNLEAVPEKDLKELYETKGFLKSMNIKEMAAAW
jgi:hypothetical protein